ncbi:MAG: DNA-primase RepB domain-containing protein [bacterium]
MEKSIEQLKLYSPGTKSFIKAVNFESGAVKTFPDITLPEYEKSLKYCKYLNAQGFNVFLSPCSLGAWILLDDIAKQTIEQLFKDGFEPFYYLETSPANYQAILRISDSPLDKDILTFISKQLAEVYGADPNSADPGHFFRLAGYTNRKLKYQKNGLFPFVKLYTGTGKACKCGKAYVERILTGINNGFIELPVKITTTPIETGERKTLETGCSAYIRKVYDTGNLSDISALDFKAAKYAILKGFKPNDIAKAIFSFSPDIQTRKKGHIDDYINRTVRNASNV